MEREDLTVELAARLVAAQFPQWAGFPITPVALSGWDNATFGLGEDMSVRLPTTEGYAQQVRKEHRWLPVLRSQLPLPIPEPLAEGVPGCGYPWPWSVYRWLPGEPAAVEEPSDLAAFATDLGHFLAALHRIDPAGGPAPSDRSFIRLGPLNTRDAETRATIAALDGEIDTRAASEVWEAALRAAGSEPRVWIHADVNPSNLLVIDGRLSAVIDFGCSGIGDPAFDLEMAWGFFSEESRAAFRASVGLDEATWARSRGWQLWGATRALLQGLQAHADWVEHPRHIIGEVLVDHANLRQ